jgi:peptidoglycan/xylan/chitin deacetylase (PgdA/CDA1 family)
VTFARRPHFLKRLALAPFARARANGRAVLLTFDDGPHPEHTPAVLDRLAAFGARAAFFLVGARVADPALVARIARAGHALGNHTFAHAVPRWWGLRTDVRACQKVVPGATLFRAPFGKLTPAQWWAARRERLACVHWALDSGDWRCRTDADARVCAREVLELVRPGDVLLLHDDHPRAGAVLDELLPGLAARGLLVDAPEG